MPQIFRRLFGLPYKLPPMNSELTPFTQDIAKLETYTFQNVFIYNEAKEGCSKFSDLLERNSLLLGTGVTKTDNYVLLQRTDGQQAFALPIEDRHMLGPYATVFGAIPAKLMGQVFTMRPNTIYELDNHFQNGIQYIRKRIKIEVVYRPKGQINARLQRVNRPLIIDGVRYESGLSNPAEVLIQTIPAWAYIGNEPYWKEQFDGSGKNFSPAKKYKNRYGDPYFHYAEK